MSNTSIMGYGWFTVKRALIALRCNDLKESEHGS
jgi:hypothetical protein